MQSFSGRLWEVIAYERLVAGGGSIVVWLGNCNKQRFLFELFYFLVSFFQGAAFGFSSIAAHSREQLEPYLPKIIPKLFR